MIKFENSRSLHWQNGFLVLQLLTRPPPVHFSWENLISLDSRELSSIWKRPRELVKSKETLDNDNLK